MTVMWKRFEQLLAHLSLRERVLLHNFGEKLAYLGDLRVLIETRGEAATALHVLCL